MRVLTKRLVREVLAARGQALAIAAVVAAGVALFVVMRSTMDSLDLSLSTWYERTRFAEIFAGATRAPRGLEADLAAIPGVRALETRVAANVLVEVPGLDEPATGRLQSIPDGGRRPRLNDVLLRSGRWPEPGRSDEILASESFAKANRLAAGDSITALINGRRRTLSISGLALSPEYTYAVRPGEMIPDEKRFAVMWMERRALASAFRMEGGFNDVSALLAPGASEDEVIARIDAILAPYGGTGAIPRARQISHWFLANEIRQLGTMGTLIPLIFLGVAAFLLNVVLHRMVRVERGQIATLKAMGRTDRELAFHTLGWAAIVALVGAVLGIAIGAWLGRGMTRLYADFFHLPLLTYRLQPQIALGGFAVALVAAAAGALHAAHQVLRLAPAEAMRPETPASFRETLIERLGFKRYLPQSARMVIRNLSRTPGRTLISIVGIAAGGALLVLGSFSLDAIDEVLDIQFGATQRFDLTVSFVEPRPPAALHSLERLPGVLRAEPIRASPASFVAGQRSHRGAVSGLPARASLSRVLDRGRGPLELPPGGLVLSLKLAEMLGVGIGDEVELELLEGRRPRAELPVVALVDSLMGAEAWMEIGALRRLLGEGDTLSAAFLLVDPRAVPRLYRELQRTPAVAGVAIKQRMIESFRATSAENMAILQSINVFFACVIAFGVVYNAARISLAERERELATLRVIGFTRTEISGILLGELAVVVALAAPLGAVMGIGFSAFLVETMGDTELYRLPLVVTPGTLAFSMLVVIAAALLSGLVVRRRLDHLDLVAVLKSRE